MKVITIISVLSWRIFYCNTLASEWVMGKCSHRLLTPIMTLYIKLGNFLTFSIIFDPELICFFSWKNNWNMLSNFLIVKFNYVKKCPFVFLTLILNVLFCVRLILPFIYLLLCMDWAHSYLFLICSIAKE